MSPEHIAFVFIESLSFFKTIVKYYFIFYLLIFIFMENGDGSNFPLFKEFFFGKSKPSSIPIISFFDWMTFFSTKKINHF
jgi:hypothetical protein